MFFSNACELLQWPASPLVVILEATPQGLSYFPIVGSFSSPLSVLLILLKNIKDFFLI